MSKQHIMTAAQALVSHANPYSDVFAVPRPSVLAWECGAARGASDAVAGSTPYEGVGGPVNFDELDGQTRLDILTLVLDIPEVKQAVQHRNAALFDDMRHGHRSRMAQTRYENTDRMLAQMLGFNLIAAASRCGGKSVRTYNAGQLFARVDRSDPRQVELERQCKASMEGALFVAAVLERYISEANDTMQQLFKERTLSFDLFSEVQLSLERLRAVFAQSHTLTSPAVKPLFAAYTESIKQYLDKRMSAFMHKADAVERRKRK